MNNLKTLTAALAASNADLQQKQQSIDNAIAKRDTLAEQINSLDAAVEGAEILHAVALASIELGERADTKSTSKALTDARLALAGKAELIQNHRVTCALVDGLTRRHAEAHAAALQIAEQHREAIVQELDERAADALATAQDHLSGLTETAATLSALRGLLEQYGHRWNRGSVTIHEAMLNPAPSIVQMLQHSIRNEFATI